MLWDKKIIFISENRRYKSYRMSNSEQVATVGPQMVAGICYWNKVAAATSHNHTYHAPVPNSIFLSWPSKTLVECTALCISELKLSDCHWRAFISYNVGSKFGMYMTSKQRLCINLQHV